MKVRPCSPRPILEPCSLGGFSYQIDPYIGCEHDCGYCYALNHAETDWSTEILIHPDLVGRLRQELSRPQPIYLGWNSDPYQPVEAVHGQTRQVLELLAERGCPVCILTKSDLVTRDVNLLATMPGSSVGFSFAFADEPVRQLFEARAPSHNTRLQALETLKNAGIDTYALICPVMPFITDVEALIDMLARCAATIWIYPLSMESETDRNWQNLREILGRAYPGLVEEYRRIAFSPADPYWIDLRRKLEQIQRERPLDLRIQIHPTT